MSDKEAKVETPVEELAPEESAAADRAIIEETAGQSDTSEQDAGDSTSAGSETTESVISNDANDADNAKPEQEEGSKQVTEPGSAEERSEAVGAEKGAAGEESGGENPDAQAEESEDEGIDGSAEVLDRAARDNLYEKGQQYEAKNKTKLALKCYLQCLRGLSGGSEFSFLPQCLRKVADLYFQQEELEKAIQFIQAEKMYYETALIDTSELQKKVEERKRKQENNPESNTDPNFCHPDAVRADEFENLARMCLEKDQAQLALEYQGKATKLRQKVYGQSHDVTTKSLDFFTIIYGEVGKQQYSESMEKLAKTSTGADDQEAPTSAAGGAGSSSSGSPPGSPQSILRRRRNLQREESKEEKRVRFTEPERARAKRQQEEYISRAILWVLLALCLLLVVVIFHYVYCRADAHSAYCSRLRGDFFYYYMRFKYLVYYYMTPTDDEANIG